MRMCLQWRHLKLLKRMGRGNEASGVAGTKEGDLVVPCMSCPHPGINLPEGWMDDTERRDEYSLKVTQDANFRLKEQLVSSHSRDPGLVDGLGYFVGRVKYEAYVLSRASEADVCLLFQGLNSEADIDLDKYLCWVPGYREGYNKIFERFTLHWSRICIMCSVGDVFGKCSR